ncbi:Retrovirus-related Pol polyprotein from transposon RE2 [Vitis vinifera]|uniref:Retrovirus-related Pol polyprotein from transposon RE2 n=1 Tax=Vitis vinifera TaxID=29760 RepID=A0A438KDN8_VITVI|nr:Retrovirus-related Pol polyprotein from transposon RE2 [Vitis vinifera]
MENELMQLKHHVSTQKRLIKELTYGIYLDLLSKETIESIIKEPVCAEQSPLSTLEAHTIDVSETLDTLLSEYRLDEALTILEMEAETFLRMQLEESYPPDMLMSYNSAMSERKALLADQLILVAENPRVAAPELQKALVGLCRLGHSHYATKLLLKYYHTRLATGIHNFQHSKSLPHGAYIRVLAKFVFSMISQAAKSFVVLYGETSPYASELIQWACEQTQVFISCFIKFVTSISEISGGLSTAVEAVQFALSYCSLLETQRIVLCPFFIKHVRPCMEEALQIRIEHFKKVIAIFAATDAWDLGRYLVSGILNEERPSMAVGQQPKILSAHKQRQEAITEDVSPLVSLQMEGPILRGLTDLFMVYIASLERAIACQTGGSIINLAVSLQQQVSVLANISTLVHFFSSIIKSIFKGISNFNCELMETPLVGCQQKDLALCLLLIQEASDQLRASFCQQFIYRMSPESGCRLTPETCGISYGDFNVFHDMIPSVVLQVLFLELRKLERLTEGNTEMEWLMELLKALMEARFAWTLNNQDIWTTSEDDLIVQHPGNFKQRKSPTSSKASEPENPPRAGHAHFSGRRLNLTRRRVRARETFSGDAPPPPASPDADQHPYLPGSPIRALHVPLLGIFVSVSPPNSLSGEVPATFSPPQSLHVPWEVFFYPSGGTTSRSEAVSLFRWCHAAICSRYEDHLVTQEADIPEVDRVQWRKIDAQLCGFCYCPSQPTGLDLSTYIGQIASLKEEFLTVMPLTPDVGAQQTQLDKFFMVLTLIGLRPDLESIRDQILGSSSVPSLDDVFARLLRISSTQTLPSDSASDSSVLVSQTTSRGGRSGTRGRGQRPHCTYCNKLGHTRDRCYQLHGRPPRTAHMAQSSDSPLPQPPSSSASQTSQASIALLPSLDLFSSITTTSDLPTVTLANGSQTVAKGPEYGEDDWHRTLSKFQKMVPRFSTLSSLPCESCQLGKHTRVSFPKRLNNRAKSPFELVHTDVWGPCRTASTLGFQYFVTFIDDYSRCTCPIYFVYVSSWILHQSSCAHTPQQNGVAERKNRHLVEIARTLLLHSHIPHSLLFLTNHFISFLLVSLVVLACSYSHSWTGQAFRQSHEDSPFFSTTSESLPVSEVLPIPIVSPPDAMPPRPLQVYHRRPRVVAPLPFPEAPADSLPIPSASPAPALPSPNDLPIAVRKGTRSTRNPHPIYNFLSYHRLSSPYSAFVSAISSVSLPKSTHEALSHPGWRQAMVDEMAALHSNGTWDLVVLPSGKSTVGCRWVYAVKVGPDGQIASVRLLLSMAAMCSWPLYQLDIKNAFLHGDLAEEVYMEQPPGFVAQGESGLVCRLRRSLYGLKQSPRAWFSRFSSVVQEFGMLRSIADHSVFYHHNSLGQCIYLVVYVDDIVITGSDQDGIQKLKQHLFTHFQTKDLGKLKYFLGIEIAQSSSGVVLSQRKYALDILEETGMLDCKPVDTPMDPNVKLVPGQGEPLGDPGRYRRLVVTCDSHWDVVIRILRYIKSTPGQGVLYENRGHTQVVGYTDADWAGSPTDRRSTSGYCVFIGGNLISWKSKKQDVVARSSAEAEYRAMALATCELIWLRHLLQELRFGKDEQMKLICDNQAALHIASNPVFHERTKHIEVDCHFIREKIASGCVATSFVNSNDQLADIFTKSLRVEIARYEGYLSNNIMNASMDFVSHMESAFLSAGLDPRRDLDEDDGWATKAATETIQRLVEMKTELPPNEETTAVREGASGENQSVYATDSCQDDASSCKDSLESEVNAAAIGATEVGINKGEVLDRELGPHQTPLGFLEEEGGSYDSGVIHATDIVASEDMIEIPDPERTKVHTTLVSTGIVGEASTAELPIEEGNHNHCSGSSLAIDKPDMSREEKISRKPSYRRFCGTTGPKWKKQCRNH